MPWLCETFMAFGLREIVLEGVRNMVMFLRLRNI